MIDCSRRDRLSIQVVAVVIVVIVEVEAVVEVGWRQGIDVVLWDRGRVSVRVGMFMRQSSQDDYDVTTFWELPSM